MKRLVISAGLPALFLSSCLFGLNYGGPGDSDLPVTWQNALPPAGAQHDLSAWWGAFGDNQLNSLLGQAFAANPDMINAALAIDKAESQLREQKADLFPDLGINGGGTNSGNFKTSTSHGKWNGGLSASWTPDIWGGTRRRVEAAFASLGSSVAAEGATRTALASGIATTYFEWISAQESLRLALEQLEYQERTYRITKERKENGFESGLDLAQAESVIASTRSQLPTYRATIRTCEATLATYLGTTPDRVHLSMPSAAIYNMIPRVPTGLPSDLLRRRPDIIKAERDLHAATAQVGASVADLFPRISLTGSTTASSGTDFANFFRNAAWSLGGSASQTLLNRVSLNEAVRRADIARLTQYQTYRKTVLAAFAEVEKCLITYAKLMNQTPELEKVNDANKRAADLSLQLYNAGHTDFLNVASAERAWLSSELNLITTRQQIRMELAKLCTALGGGWDSTRITTKP
ncbi:MAG: efflux transporter outer membrane subunit [Akkermansia sp.]